MGFLLLWYILIMGFIRAINFSLKDLLVKHTISYIFDDVNPTFSILSNCRRSGKKYNLIIFKLHCCSNTFNCVY